MSPEEHRDADTWGIRLLELVDRGFAPEATIADFASGLRAGHQEALPEVPCRGEFFMRCTTSGRWSVTWRTGPTKPSTPGPSWSESKPLPSGGMAGRTRVWPSSSRTHGRCQGPALADEVALLARWLRDDILSVPEYAIRRESCPTSWWRSWCALVGDRIRPVRTLLEKQRDNLLAFAVQLDRELAALAQEWQIRVTTAREVLQMGCNPCRRGTRSGGVVRRPARDAARALSRSVC